MSVLWLADAADAASVNNLKILTEFGLPATCAGADEFASKLMLIDSRSTLVDRCMINRGSRWA